VLELIQEKPDEGCPREGADAEGWDVPEVDDDPDGGKRLGAAVPSS
jgi:hypothetical protein